MSQCVVVDCEFQARRPEGDGPRPRYDLLQIGAVLVDITKTQIAVLPAPLNLFCKLPDGVLPDADVYKLCGLEYQRGDELAVADALRQFWDYVGRKPLVAWGGDAELLVEESQRYCVYDALTFDQKLAQAGKKVKAKLLAKKAEKPAKAKGAQ